MLFRLFRQTARKLRQLGLGIGSSDDRSIPGGETGDKFPIPPSDLIYLVDGNTDRGWFIRSGNLAAVSLSSILETRGLSLSSFGTILDFGCGCGRVIRHIRTTSKLFGCDYNPNMIDWCRANLPIAEFRVNQMEPPTGYSNDQFDFIYAFSVFTHMPEDLGRRWMAEIFRLIRPNGFFVLSLHGDSYLPQMQFEEKQRFLAGQMVVREAQAAGSNQCGAYHPYTYVQNNLGRDFQIIDYVPQGAKGNPSQDLYLLQKTTSLPHVRELP